MCSDNERLSPLLHEYFTKHHDRHLVEALRRNTVRGRMEEAFKKSDGTIADVFYYFLNGEMRLSCGHTAQCIIYMPDFGINKARNRKGKIIIEIILGNKPWKRVEDCFELQLSKETRLHDVKKDRLGRNDIVSNDDIVRYYNMFISWDDAIPLVQRVLFCGLFRQRFLMTTASRNLGSITTHRFISNIGQVLSFRSCVLNE